MKQVMTLVVIGALLISGCAQQAGKDSEPDTPRYSSVSVKNITTIVEYGKSLDWCHTNNMIAVGKRGNDSYYDVCIMNPDGTNETCLTSSGCPQKHNGNPVWHPSGEYIVFTSQNEDAVCDECDRVGIPGRGMNCNLWAVTKDGSRFWQLTDYSTSFTNPEGVIHPQFSHDGTKVLWAERLHNKRGTPWGEWVLKVADFVVDENGCSLRNIQTYQPGESARFYESHDFSRNDGKILFSGNLMENQLEAGLDIYELDLETQKLTRLTETFDDWDEHAHFSPDQKRIAWMSSTGFGDLGITFEDLQQHTWGLKLKTELWVMDADGSNKQRLTSFNEQGSPEYPGNVVVSDTAWSPDGTKIAATLAYKDSKGGRDYSSRIVLIELDFQEETIEPTNVGFCIEGIPVEKVTDRRMADSILLEVSTAFSTRILMKLEGKYSRGRWETK